MIAGGNHTIACMEPRDLGAMMTFREKLVRSSFDSLRSLRMTGGGAG